MGMIRDLSAAAVGYGIRTIQDKRREKQPSENDIILHFMETNSLEDVLDKFREGNEIRMNTDKFERFVNDLEFEVEKAKRHLV